LEIYNENIKDLISPSARNLDVRESSVKGMMVAGLTEVQVTSPAEIIELL
jgi:kinesin family protein 18/19